jgi:chromosome segregation ATPase
MAYTGIAAQRDGWQHQGEHFSLTHPLVGAAAAAKQARQRALLKADRRSIQTAESESGRETSTLELAQEPWPTPMEALTAKSEAAGLRAEDLERELSAAREQLALQENESHSLQISLDLVISENARLSCRVMDADQQIASLESALGSAHDGLALRLTETNSLQSSLDTIVSENARLFCRVMESDTAAGQAHAQLEQMKLALAATEADRAKLTAAVNEASQTRQRKAGALNALIEAMATRAVATRQLLSDAQQTLLAHTAANSAAERAIVNVPIANNAADMQIALLHKSLHAKGQQILELEQSRSKLIESTGALLQTLDMRDIALARAAEKITSLSERAARLEAEKDFATDQKKPGGCPSELKDDTDAVLAPGPKYLAASQLCSADTLLASTIAF